jgi:adenylate kinase family enzyme
MEATTRRMVVYGASGSGKSTLTREIAATVGLPAIELDAVYHARPNWDDLSREEFRAAVAETLALHPDGWVIDGNYSVARDLILPLADTVAWLRLPWRIVYPRLVKRTLTRAARNAELWGGNRETWRQTLFSRESMLRWGISAFRQQDRRTAAQLRTIPHSARVVELKSAKEVAAFSASLRDAAAGARRPYPAAPG